MLHCCLPLFYLSCIPERNENVKRLSRWSVRGHQCCEVGRTDLIEPVVLFVRSHQSGGVSLKGLHRLLDPTHRSSLLMLGATLITRHTCCILALIDRFRLALSDRSASLLAYHHADEANAHGETDTVHAEAGSTNRRTNPPPASVSRGSDQWRIPDERNKDLPKDSVPPIRV